VTCRARSQKVKTHDVKTFPVPAIPVFDQAGRDDEGRHYVVALPVQRCSCY
jgi:hypothetical protein